MLRDRFDGLIRKFRGKGDAKSELQIGGYPVSATVNTDDGLEIEEFQAPTNPTGLFQRVLVWVGEKGVEDPLVKELLTNPKLPGGHTSLIVDRGSRDIRINNMYELLERGVGPIQRSELGKLRCLIISVDVGHPLPVLLRQVMPNAKLVYIARDRISIDARQLTRCDKVILGPAAAAEGAIAHPLFVVADSEQQIAAEILSFRQICVVSAETYFYSFSGLVYKNAASEIPEASDIVFIGPDAANDDLSGYDRLGDYIKALADRSTDVLINSRWLYHLENPVAAGDRREAVRRIIELGGRVTFAGPLT